MVIVIIHYIYTIVAVVEIKAKRGDYSGIYGSQTQTHVSLYDQLSTYFPVFKPFSLYNPNLSTFTPIEPSDK